MTKKPMRIMAWAVVSKHGSISGDGCLLIYRTKWEAEEIVDEFEQIMRVEITEAKRGK